MTGSANDFNEGRTANPCDGFRNAQDIKIFSQLQQERVRGAKMADKHPSEHLIEIQEERQMVKSLADTLSPSDETVEAYNKRMKKREEFASKRKARHDEALDGYNKYVAALADECAAKVEVASENLNSNLNQQDSEIAALLRVMEIDEGDDEGEAILSFKSVEWIDKVLEMVESTIADRRNLIDKFARSLEDIECCVRKRGIDDRLRSLTEELLLAAHADQGSVERIICGLTTEANSVLAENRKEHVELVQKLLTIRCNDEKVSLTERWERGRHAWRTCRHDRAIREALERIRGPEFQDPPQLVRVFDFVKESQTNLLQRRLKILLEIRDLAVSDLTGARTQAALESLIELGDEAEKTYSVQGEAMDRIRCRIEEVGQELRDQLVAVIEQIDCRPSWGEHLTAADVADAAVSSELYACYAQLDCMISKSKEKLCKLEGEQRTRCSRVASLMVEASTALEEMKTQKQGMVKEHDKKLRKHRAEHEAECEANEGELQEYRRSIRDSAHIDPDLEKATMEAYAHLDHMAAGIEDFAKQMLDIHEEYPKAVETFFDLQKSAVGNIFGLERLTVPPRASSSDEQDPKCTKDETVNVTKEEEGTTETEQPLELWPGVAAAGMYELLDLLHFVEERICREQTDASEEGASEPTDDSATEDPKEEDPADEDAHEGGNEITEAAAGVEDSWPVRVNGDECVKDVHVELEWLCGYIHALRVKLIEFLQTETEVLLDDSKNSARKGNEELSCELDDRLRKHATRKGLVRSEWYEPRLKQIMSHKSKFERHIIGIARKSRDQDDRFDTLVDSLIEGDQRFRSTIDELFHHLSRLKPGEEADTGTPENVLSELKDLARRSRESGDKLIRLYRETLGEMTCLSDSMITQLVSANDDVIRIQKQQKLEGYSKTEIEYYSAEVSKLNESLRAKAAERQVRMNEIDAAMSDMIERPLDEFEVERKKVLEEVSVSHGLGKEHVLVRRQLQERARELSSPITESLSKISDLEKYLTKIITDSSLAVGPTAGCPRDHVLVKVTTSLELEIRGALSILVACVVTLIQCLEGVKPAHRQRYDAKACPSSRVLQRLPWTFESANDVDEASIRSDSLLAVMGPLKSDTLKPYQTAIEDEVATAKQKIGGNLPHYLQAFMDSVLDSGGKLRSESLGKLKGICSRLRDSIIPKASQVVFNEIVKEAVTRYEAEIQTSLDRCSSACDASSRKYDAHFETLESMSRIDHPDVESELQLAALKKREEVRHRHCAKALYAARVRSFQVLVERGVATCEILDSTFDCMIKHLDMVPWGELFEIISGFTGEMPKRMSLKRLLRRHSSGEVDPIDQSGESLPLRVWEGVDMTQMMPEIDRWCCTEGDGTDGIEGSTGDDFSLPTLETVDQRAVHSYRTAAHKMVLKNRKEALDDAHSKVSRLAMGALGWIKKLEEDESKRSRRWQDRIVYWGLEDLVPPQEANND
ncbi:hypothetical protein FOZ60_016397 [Perkinsus olseni]|uniref:DUF4455 domain-containing protein n=1 Tax=Perkinsus olseni TaxID=32597 RepID=A0A7J6P4P5_PEROL|nr:hypothetical protein FOZ60_016397 [Perkinsus olseni]